MNSLEQQVLRLIGEDITAPDVFVDTATGMAQIRDSITDAAQEFAMLHGGYRQRIYIPLRANTTFYRITLQDSYFAWVSDAWNVNRRRQLRQTDIVQLRSWDLRWMTYTGHPDRYIQYGLETVGFIPKPSADSEVVVMNVTTIPLRYNHEDMRVRIRQEFQDAVVSYAVAEYFASRGDARSANAYMGRYLETAKLRNEHDMAPGQPRDLNTQKWPTPTRIEAEGIR